MRRAAAVVLLVLTVAGCQVWRSRSPKAGDHRFLRAVSGADRLRVRSGGSCHREPAQETTFCELVGEEKVSDFVRRLQFIEVDGECKCCGDPTFEFYRGQNLLAMVSFHHGTHLRSREGWSGDAYLTDSSRDWLVNWLTERGVPEPKREVESARQRLRRL